MGHISNYNKDKGIVTLTLNNSISIGDSITFEKENSKYHISELMKKNDSLYYKLFMTQAKNYNC